jgi:hypothetical protein
MRGRDGLAPAIAEYDMHRVRHDAFDGCQLE